MVPVIAVQKQYITFRRMVLALLLYGTDTWPVLEANRKHLEGFRDQSQLSQKDTEHVEGLSTEWQ